MGRTPMLPFKLVYSDGYYLPIGAHVFPAEKYRRIRERLLAGVPLDRRYWHAGHWNSRRAGECGVCGQR